MAIINRQLIEKFLAEVGEHCIENSGVFFIGGGALKLLGSDRTTYDLDYIGNDIEPNDLQEVMSKIAGEMNIELEAVPIEDFLPLPKDANKRSIFIGEYGNLSVYVFDPYTIVISKLDRGFETDIEDIIFLVRRKLISLEQLTKTLNDAVEQAHKFDLDIEGMKIRLRFIQQSI